MSYGLLICSECSREVHQDGPNRMWIHCETKTPMCNNAILRLIPKSAAYINGKFCGCDDLDGVFTSSSI